MMTTRIFYHKETGAPVQIIARAQTKPTYQEVICYQELDKPYDYFVMEKKHFFSEYVKEFAELPLTDKIAIEKKEDLPDKQPRISRGEVMVEESQETEEEVADIVKAMLAFLDAKTYDKKIKILEQYKEEWNEHMLNNMAVSLDLPIEGEQDVYSLILSELRTREKYESGRGERL